MIKKILILVLVLILIGCAPQEAPEVAQKEVPDVDAEEPVIDTDEEHVATAEPEEENLGIDADVAEMLANSKKVKAFSFNDFDDTKDKFFVRGDKVKVGLVTTKTAKSGLIYNFVYINLKEGTTYGVCTDKGLCNPRNREAYFEVEYTKFNPKKNPLEVIKTWRGASFTGKTETIDKTQLREVIFTDADGNTGKALVDNFYGIPYVVTWDNGKEYRFETMIVNSPTEDEVTIPKSFDLV
tara:strand:- start:616 stop:1332 length:717 start_codon:yes stop_codon:yes gene_type:complete